jgi:recombination associated protein RdgC
MFFKNLAVYRLPADWQMSPADLEEKLITRRLQPCGHFDMSSRGWVRVTADERLVHSVGHQQLIALGVDQKILPGSVIRQFALERAEAQAVEQGFPVGRKQMRDIKLKVTEELRARALTRRRVTRAWIDPENDWFVVDAPGGAKADEVVETMRDTLGSFAVLPLDTERSPQASMAAWLQVDAAPAPFRIDDDLELKGLDKSKATIRYTRHPLDSQEVKAHLANGLYATRLGLTWEDRISLVLTEKLQVKRVQFLEMDKDTADGGDVDEAEQFDIDFTVMAGELAKLLKDLAEALQAK